MPLYPRLRAGATAAPRWKEWERRAEKSGFRRTVYMVNGDTYLGEWLDNKKHGKGIMKYARSGGVYEGEFRQGKPHGYGTYSTPDTSSGGSGVLVRGYVGYWSNGKRQGHGMSFYDDGSQYDGVWRDDLRCGNGRLRGSDGTEYEGEWYEDMQHGFGILLCGNGDKYEGYWSRGVKHGPGRYTYASSGKVFEGVWREGVPTCGTVSSHRETCTRHKLPECELANVSEVSLRAERQCLEEIEEVSEDVKGFYGELKDLAKHLNSYTHMAALDELMTKPMK